MFYQKLLVHCIYNTDLPVITVHPFRQTVEVTHDAILSATVTGIGAKNLRYQWRHNGKIIKDEDSNTLIIRNINESNNGSYICYISNEHISQFPSRKAWVFVTST